MLTIMSWVNAWLLWLSIPTHGLASVALISFLSATLLPIPAVPVIVSALNNNPSMFWPLIGIATLGNTLGSMVTWWIGFGAKQIASSIQSSQTKRYAFDWLTKLGPKACLFSWVPFLGDPLVALAGWMKLPFWPCVGYMMIGKALRYLIFTSGLTWFVY